jgi:hypothetical protein
MQQQQSRAAIAGKFFFFVGIAPVIFGAIVIGVIALLA